MKLETPRRRTPFPCTHGECLCAPARARRCGTEQLRGDHRRRRNGSSWPPGPPHHPRSGGLRPRPGRCRQKDIKLSVIEAAPACCQPCPSGCRAPPRSCCAPRRRRARHQRQVAGGPVACAWPTAGCCQPSWWCGLPASRAGVSHPPGRPRDQPRQPAPRSPDPADDAGRHIFAMGDCAACPWPGKRLRAAAPGRPPAGLASAQADPPPPSDGKPLEDYRYQDFGSLVSLGEFSTVGNMMGGLAKGRPVHRKGASQADVYPRSEDARRAGPARLGQGCPRHWCV